MNDSSFDAEWKRLSAFCRHVSDIPKLEVIPDNKETYHKCLRVLRAFFTKGVGVRSPLKGFLFEGVPGTGKTELAKQIAAGISPTVENAHFLFIDGATIATPKWGDAEKTLQAVFSLHEFLRDSKKDVKDAKVIVLFDDIECLMLTRRSDIAKEWHYSINAVLFHSLDKVDASKTFIFATTNRPDLVDEALRDRLYSIEFNPPSIESLSAMAKDMLKDYVVPEHVAQQILDTVMKKLKEKQHPTIRDAERELIYQCVEMAVW